MLKKPLVTKVYEQLYSSDSLLFEGIVSRQIVQKPGWKEITLLLSKDAILYFIEENVFYFNTKPFNRKKIAKPSNFYLKNLFFKNFM
jgi:hypothetical protein